MKTKVLLLLCGLFESMTAHVPTRRFHYIIHNRTWRDARDFCRSEYTDLASVSTLDEMDQLRRPDTGPPLAWIGLVYSAVSFQNWFPGDEPPSEDCPCMYSDGQWYRGTCAHAYPFLCYRVGAEKQFILREGGLSWSDAQLYCRTRYTDLALIQSPEENQQVFDLILDYGGWAWIGLNEGTWGWSDHTPLQLSHWLPSPENLAENTCGAEDLEHRWSAVSCELKLPFFCYNMEEPEIKTQSMVKVFFSSDLDLSDPRIHQQLAQKLEQRINRPGVRVGWKTSPKKTTTEDQTSAECDEL